MTDPAARSCRLTGARLIVRLPEGRDATSIAKFYSDNERHFAEFSPVPHEMCSVGFWEMRIDTQREDFLDGRSCKTFVFEPGDRTVIGVANLGEFIRGPFQAAYLGYSLARSKQGQGLMHEALSLLISYAFSELRLHRIMANHMPRNARSAAVLERLGFVREGVAKRYLLINGVWEDHVLTSLTNERWTPA
jgi:[ribosomal protein S5]-alanine N-acetyltransferase